MIKPLQINDLELKIVESMLLGEKYTVDKNSKNKTVQAKLLFYLYHNFPLLDQNGNQYEHYQLIHFHIEGAIIKGTLNLDGIYGDRSGYAPALKLENCTFTEEIHLSSAWFSSLSLKGSSFKKLTANFIQIHSYLDLSGIHSKTQEQDNNESGCTVIMNMACIKGNILAEKSHFSILPETEDSKQQKGKKSGTSLEYAWSMMALSLEGNLRYKTSHAEGGIDLQDASIGGDIWICESDISAKKKALNGQSLKIEGHLIIRGIDGLKEDEKGKKKQSRDVIGQIFLLGSRISGTLEISNINFRNYPEYKLNNINLYNVYIGSSIEIEKIAVDNSLLISNSIVKNNCELSQCQIQNDLDLSNLKVSDSILIDRVSMNNLCSLENTQAGMDIEITYLSSLQKDEINEKIPGLLISYMEIAQNVTITQKEKEKLKRIEFEHSKAGGDVELNNVTVTTGISFKDSLIAGCFILKSFTYQIENYIQPVLDLSNMSIKNELNIENMKVAYPENTKLPFKDKKYTENLIKDQARVTRRDIPLSFYKGYKIIEIRIKNENDSKILTLLSEKNEKGEVYLLDGNSNIFHAMNDHGRLKLSNKKQAAQYLHYFCTHLKGENGRYYIMESVPPNIKLSDSDIKYIVYKVQKWNMPLTKHQFALYNRHPTLLGIFRPIRIKKHKENYYQAKAVVNYENIVMRCQFSIEQDGSIEMIDDEPLYQTSSTLNSDSELITGANIELDSVLPDCSQAKQSSIKKEHVKELLDKLKPIPYKDLSINLQKTKVGVLNDNNGISWGESIRLNLHGFHFSFLFGEKSINQNDFKINSPFFLMKERKKWLNKQYPSGKATKHTFFRDPYLNLAHVLRTQGEDKASREIIYEMKKTEMKFESNLITRIKDFIFCYCFGFGLKPYRALITIICYWFIGFAFTLFLNSTGRLVLDPLYVSTVPVTVHHD